MATTKSRKPAQRPVAAKRMGRSSASQLYEAACAELARREPQGYECAFQLFGEAVTAGSMPARYRLGLMLMHGLGTRRNIPGALEHFAIAAAHGDTLAASRWRWLMALEGFLWSRASAFSGLGR